MEEQSTFSGSNSDRNSETIQVSRVLRPNVEEQAFHHHLTLGIEDTLQAHPLIKDIKMIIRPPVLPAAVISWERKYKRKLPSDFKNYYYSTNGFRLTWSLDYGGDLLRVGEMSINSLSQLIPLENGTTDDSNKMGNLKLSTNPGSKDGKGNRYAQSSSDKGSTSKQDLISFAELQKMKSESKSTSLLDSSKIGKHNSSCPRKLSFPTEGQAFQLDSSKQSEKGVVCLVYLKAISKMHRHHTPKKKTLTKIRMVDFSRDFGNKSGNFSPDLSTMNKSIEELEEEQEVADSQSSFMSDDECLVQVWFLDPSFQWHFLAPTFSHYYRMLLYHFGLPEWEYRFTPYGVSSWAEQMFWLIAPHLLQPVKNQHKNSSEKNIWSTDYPSDAGKPNPVNNVINMNLFRKKKKDRKVD